MHSSDTIPAKNNQRRTKKRSRSGAATVCPHCAKKLRGAKGLKRHLADQHVEVL